jgi:oligogalacturonide lyase
MSVSVLVICGAAVVAQPASPGASASGVNPSGRDGQGRTAAAVAMPKFPDASIYPKEWIDPDTGHRVIRLSTENGSQSAYFHYNEFSLDGKKLVFIAPSGISAVDLATHQVEVVVPGQPAIMETGLKTNEAFYTHDGAVWAADINTHAARKLVDLPAGSNVTCVNCDETLFAGTITGDAAVDPSGAVKPPAPRDPPNQLAEMFPGKTMDQLTPLQQSAVTKEQGLSSRIASPAPMALFTINAKTGARKVFGFAYAWLNHLQFSPTDPNLLMFCHEGTWHENDRIWNIRVDGANPTAKLMHARTMPMEIAGHEWWGHDGKMIFFDLQTPRSQQFWIAGVNPITGDTVKYHLEQNWWGIHFQVSNNGKMFASDGGDPGQVAFAPNGAWINLFRVQPDGTLSRERLVNMANQNYVTGNGGLEPNVQFTPDDKWVIFRANILGPTHAFAVEIARTANP